MVQVEANPHCASPKVQADPASSKCSSDVFPQFKMVPTRNTAQHMLSEFEPYLPATRQIARLETIGCDSTAPRRNASNWALSSPLAAPATLLLACSGPPHPSLAQSALRRVHRRQSAPSWERLRERLHSVPASLFPGCDRKYPL